MTYQSKVWMNYNRRAAAIICNEFLHFNVHSNSNIMCSPSLSSMFLGGKSEYNPFANKWFSWNFSIFRVNLIGEHIDYCGYPVLPMALEQSILLAVAPSSDQCLHITNINQRYKPFKCSIHSIRCVLSFQFYGILSLFHRLFLYSIKVPENGIPPEWYSYFLCGVKGISDELLPNGLRCGMFVTVSGNVPPAAGLSSSSALVSAATLATSYINDVGCIESADRLDDTNKIQLSFFFALSVFVG